MFTKDEIRNILIVRAREYYGQVEFAKMAKGQSDAINTIAEDLFQRLNAEIDLAVQDLQFDLTGKIEKDDEED